MTDRRATTGLGEHPDGLRLAWTRVTLSVLMIGWLCGGMWMVGRFFALGFEQWADDQSQRTDPTLDGRIRDQLWWTTAVLAGGPLLIASVLRFAGFRRAALVFVLAAGSFLFLGLCLVGKSARG
jgi:hypothetical protein